MLLGREGDGQTPCTLADLADRKFLIVSESTPLHDVMTRSGAALADVALVTDGSESVSSSNIRGLITKSKIANTVIEALSIFTE